MKTIAVLGGFYGDEAKAKIVDVLAIDADVVVRFQGGNNAGHTIRIGDNKYVLHLVPAGIFYDKTVCVIGNGVVIDLFSLYEEMEKLKQNGVDFKNRFFIDSRAHIVLPIHKRIDNINEDSKGESKIGTTGRGIGPCYTDKSARIGLRVGEIVKAAAIKERLRKIYAAHGSGSEEEEINELSERLASMGEYFSEYLEQVPYLLDDFHKKGKKIIFEGAQGTLLDLDYGSYPYVTSSNTVLGGISVGCGFPTRKIQKVIGVFKSYITRVGNGPLVTELYDEDGEKIRKIGNEYGSSTGRPRRCGWFDAVAARYSALLNGFDEAALTLLDVLQSFDSVKICYAYSIDGKTHHNYPAETETLFKAEPLYLEMPGWKKDITNIRDYDKLPPNAQAYVEKVAELINIPISIVSVGADRSQTIFV